MSLPSKAYILIHLPTTNLNIVGTIPCSRRAKILRVFGIKSSSIYNYGETPAGIEPVTSIQQEVGKPTIPRWLVIVIVIVIIDILLSMFLLLL